MTDESTKKISKIEKDLEKLKQVVEGFSEIQDKRGIFLYAPPSGLRPGAFGGTRADDKWSQGGPISWCEAGPGWFQSGGELWGPEEELIDFGGKFTSQLAIVLAELGARVIQGSVEEARWRIAVRKEKLEAARALLQKENAEFIRTVSVR